MTYRDNILKEYGYVLNIIVKDSEEYKKLIKLFPSLNEDNELQIIEYKTENDLINYKQDLIEKHKKIDEEIEKLKEKIKERDDLQEKIDLINSVDTILDFIKRRNLL